MKKSLIGAIALTALVLLPACGSKNSDSQADSAAFAANQPVESGIYNATAYDITGDDARHGKFDGRIIVALSPSQSALYVYENGNRTKINYSVVLERPFEKGDSGVYRAVDMKGKPVIVDTDSAVFTLTFEKNTQQVTIDFDKTPRSTGSAMDMMERMNEQFKKK